MRTAGRQNEEDSAPNRQSFPVLIGLLLLQLQDAFIQVSNFNIFNK